MIINALHKWAFIEIPRTGTKSLREALMQIPGTFLYGNHNEITTLPEAFKDFRIAVVVRDPVHRLYSIYRYMRMTQVVQRHPEWFDPLHREVMEMTFSEWIVDGKALFCGGAWPYTVAHMVPEQDKGQASYFTMTGQYAEIFPHENLFSLDRDRNSVESLSSRILNNVPIRLRHLNSSVPVDGGAGDPYTLLNAKAADKVLTLDGYVYATIYHANIGRLRQAQAA